MLPETAETTLNNYDKVISICVSRKIARFKVFLLILAGHT